MDYNRTLDVSSLADLVTRHDRGPIYVKSARTAGEACILKVERDPKQGLIITSNSPEVRRRFDQYLKTRNYFLERAPLTAEQRDEQLKRLGESLEPTNFLRALFPGVEAPIIE